MTEENESQPTQLFRRVGGRRATECGDSELYPAGEPLLRDSTVSYSLSQLSHSETMARKRHPPILDRTHISFALVSFVLLILVAEAAHGKPGWREQAAGVLNPSNWDVLDPGAPAPGVQHASDWINSYYDLDVLHIGLRSARTA
jgi:hypothetical protein